MADTPQAPPPGGFHASVGFEVDDIGVHLRWDNWSDNSSKPEADDDMYDFMVGYGDGLGGSGKNQPLRLVLSRLVAEARAARDGSAG